MDNETETAKAYIRNLPNGLRNFVLGDSWSQKLDLIEKNNKLSDEQSGALSGEVFLILTGIENYSDFAQNVQKNVTGVINQTLTFIISDIDKNIFSEVRLDLLNIEKRNNAAPEIRADEANKDSILHGIENPAPVKLLIVNPAGVNPILDGQNNLPAGERKIEPTNKIPAIPTIPAGNTMGSKLSSSAVPSRGPLIGNYKVNLSNNIAPIPVTKTDPIIKAAPIYTKPVVPVEPIKKNYSTDPYREPIV